MLKILSWNMAMLLSVNTVYKMSAHLVIGSGSSPQRDRVNESLRHSVFLYLHGKVIHEAGILSQVYGRLCFQ